MTNVFATVGHDLKVAGEDVAKAVETPIKFLVKAEKVFASAIHDQPELKAGVVELVTKAEAVISDLSFAAAAKGADLATDAKALADAESFFEYFKNTFIPMVETVYKEVAADIQ